MTNEEFLAVELTEKYDPKKHRFISLSSKFNVLDTSYWEETPEKAWSYVCETFKPENTVIISSNQHKIKYTVKHINKTVFTRVEQ